MRVDLDGKTLGLLIAEQARLKDYDPMKIITKYKITDITQEYFIRGIFHGLELADILEEERKEET